MTAMEVILGPMLFPFFVSSVALTGSPHALDDADDSDALLICIKKDGSITKVGFNIVAINGSPPAYNVGIVTLDASGFPTTTAYGGSAITSWTPAATGWNWVTLSTPATANAGDFCAVRIYPGGTPPDGSNNVTISSQVLGGSAASGTEPYPKTIFYDSGWNARVGPAGIACQYSGGEIIGFSVEDRGGININIGTTPDEVGNLFTVPVNCTICGARMGLSNLANGTTFDLNLYDNGGSLLASMAMSDEDFLSNARIIDLYFDPVNLTAGSNYRLVIEGTAVGVSTTPVELIFDAAADRLCLSDGVRYQKTERTDAGAWTDTSTRIVLISPIISDITSVPGTTGGSYTFA